MKRLHATAAACAAAVLLFGWATAAALEGPSVEAAPGDAPASPLPSDEELVPIPAEGDFEQEQLAFVEEVEPADEVYAPAVLEAGEEACIRIERTARIDEAALVSALMTGEIPDAEAAITYLCPEFSDVLADALEQRR